MRSTRNSSPARTRPMCTTPMSKCSRRPGSSGLVLFLIFVVTAFRRIRVILNDPALSTEALAYARCAAAIVLGIAVWFNDNAVFGNQPETVLLAVMLGVLAAIPALDRRTDAALQQERVR